jgi:ribosomal protein S18 acetylase RimI-like enzyme
MIREANLKDVDSNLLNLFIYGYNLHYVNRKDKFNKKDKENLKNGLIDSLNGPDNILVLEIANKIIGYISFQYKGKVTKCVWIDELIIDENEQNKGYGKQLINEVRKIAKKDGCKSIEFCCWSFNNNAMNVYKKLGYREQRVIFEDKL